MTEILEIDISKAFILIFLTNVIVSYILVSHKC